MRRGGLGHAGGRNGKGHLLEDTGKGAVHLGQLGGTGSCRTRCVGRDAAGPCHRYRCSCCLCCRCGFCYCCPPRGPQPPPRKLLVIARPYFSVVNNILAGLLTRLFAFERLSREPDLHAAGQVGGHLKPPSAPGAGWEVAVIARW
jgi:hypothetical protein